MQALFITSHKLSLTMRSLPKAGLKDHKTIYIRVKPALLLVSLIFVHLTNVFGQTPIQVGGTIIGEKTWVNEYIYEVISTVSIPSDAHLIIEPGTTIKFNINTGIDVFGQLTAIGSQQDSIRFEPNHPPIGQNWKWNGIRFVSKLLNDTSIISHAHLALARSSITIDRVSNNVVIKNTTIRDSDNHSISIEASEGIIVKNNRIFEQTGLLLTPRSVGIKIINAQNCIIAENRIHNNSGGIWLIANGYARICSNNIIVGNNISENFYESILMNSDNGGVCVDNMIIDNYINSNFVGIQIGSSTSHGVRRNIIKGNIIISDQQRGLDIYNDSTVIEHNLFMGNSFAILINGSMHCLIRNNHLHSNEVGIVLGRGSENTLIELNTFSRNQSQLIVIDETNEALIHRNNFLDNISEIGLIWNTTSNNLSIHENYWGTDSVGIIAEMIHDGNDDPQFGILDFQPFLLEPDTVAPVSAPWPVFKQFTGSKLRVFWDLNPESDVKGYAISSGPISGYLSPVARDLGIATFFESETLTIYDTIAVTAYDTDSLMLVSPAYGHISPFSFAMWIPYAGPDTTICNNAGEVLLSKSTAFEYNSLYWETSGDGSFNNHNMLWPIYYPGFADINNGKVELTLHTIRNNEYFSDHITLYFVDAPSASAGADTVISPGETLLIQHAEASNFDYLHWITTGDGSFNNADTLHPVYTPGNTDRFIGSVQLILIAGSECGETSDTLELQIRERYNIHGKVWYKGVGAFGGIVLAAKQGPMDVTIAKLASISEEGHFRLSNLEPGNYFLYAVPDTSGWFNGVPGYYVNCLRWKDAYLLNLSADVYGVDIFLSEFSSDFREGSGRISGYFALPEAGLFDSMIYCSNWFGDIDTTSNFCKDGLANVTILLYNSTREALLGATITGQSGRFDFQELPYGSYIIDAELAGFTTIPSQALTLSPQNPQILDIVLSINLLKNITVSGGVMPNPYHIRTMAYPNPASDRINVISSLTDGGVVDFQIRNTFGQVVLQGKHTSRQVGSSIVLEVDVSGLEPGFYQGTITAGVAIEWFTFVKN